MPEESIVITIVGRPNTGKSLLFNRICKKNLAIVDDFEGVTRDQLCAPAECFGRYFSIVDTAGIGVSKSDDPFYSVIAEQSHKAIEASDLLILVVDGVVGITTEDERLARFLLKSKKRVVLAVNKIDNLGRQGSLVSAFYGLGISPIIPVSAMHNFQIAELLEAALAQLPEEEATKLEEPIAETPLQIAIVGIPNVGKSTLINALLDEPRCVVSPIAGTTRDSVDIEFSWEGHSLLLIDTAGVRRKNRKLEAVDKFAFIRTQRAVERSDVCVLVLDATRGLAAEEKKLLAWIAKEGKPAILLFNKWDLMPNVRTEHYEHEVKQLVPFVQQFPTLFISAQRGKRVDKLLPLIIDLHERQSHRIPTPLLNRFLARLLAQYAPPRLEGKRLKIYYATQVGCAPPHFVLFVNDPHLMGASYLKYLHNAIQKEYNLGGMPLQLQVKPRRAERGAPPLKK